MRENSAPVVMVNSAPTTPGSMKSGFPCYWHCKNTSTAYQIHMDFAVAVDVLLQEQENPDFIEPGVAC